MTVCRLDSLAQAVAGPSRTASSQSDGSESLAGMVVGVMGILRQLSTLHQLKTLNYLQLKLTLCFPFDTIRSLCGAVLSSSSSSLF